MMGDFVSPRRAVVDRLKRRLETYKRGHKYALGRHQFALANQYENQRQDTMLLHQKWVEGKAKKAAKNSRVIRDPTVSASSTSGLSQSKAKKPKLEPVYDIPTKNDSSKLQDGTSSCPSPQDDTRGNTQHSVSVNIEQIIKPQSSGTSQIEIKLKSTVHTSEGESSTTKISTSTNICKEDPLKGESVSNPSSDASLSLGFDDVDELQEILDALNQEPDLMSGLDASNNGHEGEKQDISAQHQAHASQNSSSHQMPISNTDFTKQNMPDRNNFFEPAPSYQELNKDYQTQEHNGTMFGVGTANSHFSNINCQSSNSNAESYQRPQIQRAQSQPNPGMSPSITSFADTGPAAKTLQQMAAQHQSQSIPNSFPPENYIPDTRTNMPPSYARQGYIDPQTPNENYRYNQNMSMYMKGNEQEIKPEPETPSPAYGTQPKTLMHYDMGGRINSASGIPPQITNQQIVNQHPQNSQYVKNIPETEIKISQTQEITVKNPPPHQNINFSQTQKIQIPQDVVNPVIPHSYSHPAYHLPGNGGQTQQRVPQQSMPSQTECNPKDGSVLSQGNYIPQEVKMQLYQEKLLQQQNFRHQLHQQQLQQQQQQQQRQQHQHNSMYAGRPRYQMNSTIPHSEINSNPLQTMQSMVDQTNQATSYDSSYTNVKQNIPVQALPPKQLTSHSSSEPVTLVDDKAAVQSRLQSQISESQSPSSVPSQNMYSVQNNTVPSVNSTEVKVDNSTGYTSTLMRGQRPPNVNVGPEGLNIGQPRVNSGRNMLPMSMTHRSLSHNPNHVGQINKNYTAPIPQNMYPYHMQMMQQQNMHMNPQTRMGSVAMHQQQQMRFAHMPYNVAMNQHQSMQYNTDMNVMSQNSQHQDSRLQNCPQGRQASNFASEYVDPHTRDLFNSTHNMNTEFNFEDILSGK